MIHLVGRGVAGQVSRSKRHSKMQTSRSSKRFVIRRIPSRITTGEYGLSLPFAYRCKWKGLDSFGAPIAWRGVRDAG